MAALLPTLTVVCLAITAQRSFVGTAPLNEGATQDFSASGQDASVRELESLKHTLGKTLAMMKTQSSVYTDINGQKEEHTDRREEVKENGKLIARVGQHLDAESRGPDEAPTGKIRMDVEIPSKGIHKSVVQPFTPEYEAAGALTENVNRRSPVMSSSIGIEALTESGNNVDRYNTLSGAQYSPLDMAEYVFWTGDEKGVTLAIEEFLQEGLMTREEAISFLQEIKNNLDYLKNHYTQLGLNSREHSKNPDTAFKYPSYGSGGSKNNAAMVSSASDKQPELRNTFDINQLRQEVNKKRGAPSELSHPGGVMGRENLHKSSGNDKSQEEDYEELLERLRVADFLYTEYSLEEVIYQLAKVMFTQSLTRGSAEAQQALQKFTNFLEMEAEQGHISRALEKKVLDVLIASLSDTLSEHPELLSTARESLGPSSFPSSAANADVAAAGQHFLRQILEISPKDKAVARASKEHESGSRSSQALRDQIKEMNMAAANHVSMGLGKYKNP